MRPPTEDAGAVEETEPPKPGEKVPSSVTEDKQVSEWVHKQLELKQQGLLSTAEKPALHTVALDKVATSPATETPAPSLEG